MDQVAQTVAERTKIYGDPLLCHQNIALAWTGLIQNHYGHALDHPLPAFLVAQMMVALKLVRSTRVYHEDNYVDLAAFSRFAEGFQLCGPSDSSKGSGASVDNLTISNSPHVDNSGLQ